MKINIYIFLLLLATSNAMVAQEKVRHLAVEELFELGIQNSLQIQKSVVKEQLSDDKLSIAKNKRLPDINVGGTFGYAGTPVVLNRDLSFNKRSNVPHWKQNYLLSASQPLYEGGRIKNNIEKAKLEKEIAALSLEQDKSNLKLWLMDKYLNLFNLNKSRQVYQKNIEEAKIRLHDIQKMKEEGIVTTNDVLRSKLLLTNYELALQETENDLILTSQQLDIVLGLDEETILVPDEDLLLSAFELEMEGEYVARAYQQYSNMKIANVNIDIAKTNLKLIKADFLPSLSLQASNTLARPLNTSPVQDLYMNSWGVMLNLSYNISSWFDKKRKTSSARYEIDLQQLALQEEMQNIRLDVKAAYIKHQEALDRIKSLDESLIQANENYRIVKNKYFNQLAILTDLLDANSIQLESELQLTIAKTTAIYTFYQLQRVSGNL